jgi:hypothetical protein
MGGVGSGGLRPGAGRKSKRDQDKWLGGNAGKRAPKTPPVAASTGLMMAAPVGMADAAVLVWNELAPHACAERTLTPATAAAFRQLCGRIVLLELLEKQIADDGIMTDKVTLQMDEKGGGLQQVEKKAHDLLTKCMTLMQRVDQGMLRFRLSPMGKELAPPEKAPDDPFSEFDKTVN